MKQTNPTEELYLQYIADTHRQAASIKMGYTLFPTWRYVDEGLKRNYIKLAKLDVQRWKQEQKKI